MKRLFLLLLLFTFATVSINAQTQRYLDDVFTGVTTTKNVVYAQNYTVLAVPQTGRTLRQPLFADIYQPNGDTETKRPLMIYVITGNFLPSQVPGLRDAPNGFRTDSAAVEIATRFAKKGYVSAVIDYRLGWNPIATAQEERTSTLINAAYRGLQDVRSAIRFFKAQANTYKIDTSKIVLWGQGTGGYITLAAATLDKYSEVLTTKKPAAKFFKANGQPMVIEKVTVSGQDIYINGDVEGKILGTVPAGTVGPPPGGDTLNLPNNADRNSDFQLCVNVGGALGDISWVDSKSVPMLSIQCVHDQNAPYESAVLGVPINATTSLPVVEVQGGKFIQTFIDDSTTINKKLLGLKDAYNPYKSLFTARNGGKYVTGLYPMFGDTISDASPYEFYTPELNLKALSSNPRISSVKARKYIDSMMTFVLPRACIVLNLPCVNLVSSTEELLNENTTKLVASPNPSQSQVLFESDIHNPIKAVELFDMSGRSVLLARNINNHQYQLSRGSLPSGMYIAKVKFEGGVLSKKIVFENK